MEHSLYSEDCTNVNDFTCAEMKLEMALMTLMKKLEQPSKNVFLDIPLTLHYLLGSITAAAGKISISFLSEGKIYIRIFSPFIFH